MNVALSGSADMPKDGMPRALGNESAVTTKSPELERAAKERVGVDEEKEGRSDPTKSPDGVNGHKPAGAARPQAASSNAELKERKKAEKAAKRAQAKEGRAQEAPPDLKGPKKVDKPTEAKRKGSVSGSSRPAPKGQQRPAGSVQQALPVRHAHASLPAESTAAALPGKKVALFGHLYGSPRRTTIAATGKDVHPAVLALGLQMSNYVVCGSNARCVATLTAFKRVTATAFHCMPHPPC
jgi:translation initiation factor eIF-2B subunit delta